MLIEKLPVYTREQRLACADPDIAYLASCIADAHNVLLAGKPLTKELASNFMYMLMGIYIALKALEKYPHLVGRLEGFLEAIKERMSAMEQFPSVYAAFIRQQDVAPVAT